MALLPRCVLVAALGVPLALVSPVLLAVLLVLLVVGVAADLVLAGSPRRLRLARDGATSARLGEPAQVELVVDNAGRRRVRGVVRDAWTPSAGATPPRAALDVPAGERRRHVTTLRPTRRGVRRADRVTVRAHGPFGLAARQRSLSAPWAVQVLPAFASRRHLPARLARLRELEGGSAARTRGRGTELDALREYVPGDDGRDVDWRATARRGSVVVRTYRPERDRRVLLLLDTGRAAAGRLGDATRLDHALDACLLLGVLAARAGDRVGLVARDAAVRAWLPAAPRHDVLRPLAAALAPVEPALVEPDHRATVVDAMRLARGRSLVVLLTSLDPASFAAGWLPALPPLAARHLLLVASVSDPRVDELAMGRERASDAYAAAAAESARSRRADMAARLRRLGAEVVDAPPGTFAPALADAYLALKAAGRA